MIDHQRRLADRHAPTIGILICTQGKEQVIRFALGSSTAPMAVATFTYDTLPAAERAALPPVTEIVAAVTAAIATSAAQAIPPTVTGT